MGVNSIVVRENIQPLLDKLREDIKSDIDEVKSVVDEIKIDVKSIKEK